MPIISGTYRLGMISAIERGEMPLNNGKLQLLAILLASSATALDAKADLESVLELGTPHMTSLRSQVPFGDLGLSSRIWLPKSANDVRDYFRFHQRVEVYNLMLELNRYLNLNVPESLIRVRSIEHDEPKVVDMERLKLFGYAGWERELALNFLSVLLNVKKKELDKQIEPGKKFLEVDLSQRLLFSFGISKANYDQIFKDEKARKFVLAELNSLPSEINALEDKMKAHNRRSRVKVPSQANQNKLALLENLADFVARTQNFIARVEYGKVFIPTSSYIQSDIESLKKAKWQELSFVYHKLHSEAGLELMSDIGLDKLMEALKYAEVNYIEIIKKSRINRENDFSDFVMRSNSQGKRADFVQINSLEDRRVSLKKACKTSFGMKTN